ncbi:MAG: GGDEF domain-containing protein [Helicobacteraceae bacterium]
MLVKDIIKKTLLQIQQQGITITPEVYAKTFCELAKKAGLALEECAPAKKYIKKLPPAKQEEALARGVEQLDELAMFLIASYERDIKKMASQARQVDDGALAKVCKTYSELLKDALEPSFTKALDKKISLTKARLEKNFLAPAARLTDDIKILVFERIEKDNIEITKETATLEESLDAMLVSMTGIVEKGKTNQSNFTRLTDEIYDMDAKHNFSSLKEKLLVLTSSFKCEFEALLGDMESKKDEISSLRQTVKVLNTQLQNARQQAKEDFLTGVLSKRGLDEALKILEEAHQQKDLDYALFFIDIDYFKNINDTFGHMAGDTILKALAQTLKNNTRSCDYTARYGGEEFVIAMPGVTLEEAQKIAERIRLEIQDSIYSYEDSNIKFTISTGLCLRSNEPSLTSALKTADANLYASKEGGRNRITV